MKKINKFFEHGNKNPKHLVIFLHGYGSNGEDLIALAPEFQSAVKDAYFISPNAPMELPIHFFAGYQWFELENRDPKIMYPQIIQANNFLDDFIKEQLERFKLTYKDLIFIGFSQGGMMALYNSLRAKQQAKATICLSGRFISPKDLGEKINSKPEICLIHGKDDEVVHFEHFLQSKTDLTKVGVDFEAHEIDNLGHSINFAVVKRVREFLTKITDE